MDAGRRKRLMGGALCAALLLAAPAKAAGTPPIPDELRALADTVLARLSKELAASDLRAASFGVEALVIDPETGGKPPQPLGMVERRAPPQAEVRHSRAPYPGRKPAPAGLDAVARAFVKRIGAAYREPVPALVAENPQPALTNPDPAAVPPR